MEAIDVESSKSSKSIQADLTPQVKNSKEIKSYNPYKPIKKLNKDRLEFFGKSIDSTSEDFKKSRINTKIRNDSVTCKDGQSISQSSLTNNANNQVDCEVYCKTNQISETMPLKTVDPTAVVSSTPKPSDLFKENISKQSLDQKVLEILEPISNENDASILSEISLKDPEESEQDFQEEVDIPLEFSLNSNQAINNLPTLKKKKSSAKKSQPIRISFSLNISVNK